MNTKEEEPKDVEPNHGEQIESLNEAVDPAKKRRQVGVDSLNIPHPLSCPF